MGYYEDKDHISNSNLGWLLKSPAYFKRKITNPSLERIESLSLERGTLLHMAILEPHKFVVSSVEPVSGMMGKFIEERFKAFKDNNDANAAISELDELAYKRSGFKITKEKVLEKFESPENQAYYNFLRSANGKIALSKEDADVINRCKSSVEKHKAASKLLFDEKQSELFEKDDTYNELPIYWIYQVIDDIGQSYDVSCKSLIDRLVIDHNNKLIKCIDLKTTAKSVNNVEAIKVNSTGNPLVDYQYTGFMNAYAHMYRYYRQQAYYEFAVMYYLTHDELHKQRDYSEYKLVSYCIAVETTGSNDCAVFEIPQALLTWGEKEFNELIKRYIWHLNSDQWDYPREYYEGSGIIRLEI